MCIRDSFLRGQRQHRQSAAQDIQHVAEGNRGNKLLLKLKLFKTVHCSRILLLTLEDPSVGYREVLPYLHVVPSPATSCTFHSVLLPTWLAPQLSVLEIHTLDPVSSTLLQQSMKKNILKEC